jgi:dsDNA-binding SOS-regulon protein
MKLLNIYRSEPNDDVKKLVEIVSRDREAQSFDLNVDAPDYDKMLDMVFDADQTICWW